MNKYTTLKVLGEGGYGKALLVERKKDHVKFVVKEVRMSNLKRKEKLDAKKEVDVLRALSHPYIVAYIESFEENGKLYIVMEYADGGDLSQKIQKQGKRLFSEEEILHYFTQIALALKYMHDRKILHRDLKGQNVFLCKDGKVKLGDFGIAKVLDCTAQLCQTQIGTPYYLSPEICEGKKYSSKTDIWSLGCILYELCTLKHPFDATNMNALLACIIRGRYAPISTQYSSELRGLVAKMLTKDPKARPSINAIVNMPIIKNRLVNYLDEALLNYELSHTILHGRKPLQAPTMRASQFPASNDVVEQRKLPAIPESKLEPPQPVYEKPKNPKRIDYRKDHSPLIIPPKKIESPEEKAAKEEERKRKEAEEAKRKKVEAEKKKQAEIKALKDYELKRQAQLELEKRRAKIQADKEKRKREAEEFIRKKRERELQQQKMDEQARQKHREEILANMKRNQEADAERRRKMREERERRVKQKRPMRNATPDPQKQVPIQHEEPASIAAQQEPAVKETEPTKGNVVDSFYNCNKEKLPAWANDGKQAAKQSPEKRHVSPVVQRGKNNLNDRPAFDLGIDEKKDEEPKEVPEVDIKPTVDISPEERRRLWKENIEAKKRNREHYEDRVVGAEPDAPLEIVVTPSIAKSEISEEERRKIYKENREASKKNKENHLKNELDQPPRSMDNEEVANIWAKQREESLLSAGKQGEAEETGDEDEDDFEFDIDDEVDDEIAEEMETSAKLACSIHDAFNAVEGDDDSFGDSDDEDDQPEQSVASRIEAIGMQLEKMAPPEDLVRYRSLMAQDHADLHVIPDVILYYLQQLAALEANL